MTHRYHPDPERNDPEDAIVWDDCADCACRSELIGLDTANSRRAIALMLHVERGGGNGRRHYLTVAEKDL